MIRLILPIPTIAELHEKAARIGPSRPGWRVYLLDGIYWVTRLDLAGNEQLLAGVCAESERLLWCADLTVGIGQAILDAAGAR